MDMEFVRQAARAKLATLEGSARRDCKTEGSLPRGA